MASLFDVLDALQAMTLAAMQPLVGRIVDVAQGWPQPDDVDTAVKAGRTLVSIYPVPSTTSKPPQPMNWEPQVIAAPVHGLTATATEDGFTLAGAPNVGEYATAVLSGQEAFSYTAVANDTAATVAAALAAQIGPRAVANGATVTLTSVGTLAVRIGAPGTLGQFLHRQTQQFRVIVWAPVPADRAAIAAAIDVALQASLTFALPDTSVALMTYQTLNLDDRYTLNGCYRADLFWAVTWDTYAQAPGYEVTSVDVTLNAAPLLLTSAT